MRSTNVRLCCRVWPVSANNRFFRKAPVSTAKVEGRMTPGLVGGCASMRFVLRARVCVFGDGGGGGGGGGGIGAGVVPSC